MQAIKDNAGYVFAGLIVLGLMISFHDIGARQAALMDQAETVRGFKY